MDGITTGTRPESRDWTSSSVSPAVANFSHTPPIYPERLPGLKTIGNQYNKNESGSSRALPCPAPPIIRRTAYFVPWYNSSCPYLSPLFPNLPAATQPVVYGITTACRETSSFSLLPSTGLQIYRSVKRHCNSNPFLYDGA